MKKCQVPYSAVGQNSKRKVDKRPIGLNSRLSIRNCTLTSCHKGLYWHINRPMPIMEINLNKKVKKKAALYPHNTIAIKHCDVYWYNIIHNFKPPPLVAPPPSTRPSYRQTLCPGGYEIYNFGKFFLGSLICLIHTPEITTERELS